MFKVVEVFVRIGIKVAHNNQMESVLNSRFDMFNDELAKNFAFGRVVFILETIVIDYFKFFVREIKIGCDKSTAMSMDFLNVFRNEVGED